MEQQAECIGSKTVAAQAVSSKTIFELLNAVLTFPTIVIERKNGTAAARQVSDQETQVGTGCGMFGLVADAPLMRPGVGTIAKAGKGALRLAGSTITSRETTLEPAAPQLATGSCDLFRWRIVGRKTHRIHRVAGWRNQRQRVI